MDGCFEVQEILLKDPLKASGKLVMPCVVRLGSREGGTVYLLLILLPNLQLSFVLEVRLVVMEISQLFEQILVVIKQGKPLSAQALFVTWEAAGRVCQLKN